MYDINCKIQLLGPAVIIIIIAISLTPSVPNGHRSQQVLSMAFTALAKVMTANFCCSANTGVSAQENIADRLVLASPKVPRIF